MIIYFNVLISHYIYFGTYLLYNVIQSNVIFMWKILYNIPSYLCYKLLSLKIIFYMQKKTYEIRITVHYTQI